MGEIAKKNSTTLYKRDAKNNIIFWNIINNGTYCDIEYGILNKSSHKENIMSEKKDEYNSRINAKRKEGYKSLEDLYDNSPNIPIPDSKDFEHYLQTYLPKFNTTSTGFVLPMLAKTLEDNKPFEKVEYMLAQWKINGLRCLIGAKRTNDLFAHVELTYTSREGTSWNLPHLDAKILPFLSKDIIELLIEEEAYLDGELYLPGYSVNDINSFVKNNTVPQHFQLQYWCYDLAYDNVNAIKRSVYLQDNINIPVFKNCNDISLHLDNREQFVLLPTDPSVDNITKAVELRNKYIGLGFEGLILRNPLSTYAFGKRNSSMFKFKRKEDGLFDIVDIKPDKRGLPIFTLRNDINDELFDSTINCDTEHQKFHLINKQQEIGKKALVEYRERSGVKSVPFHAKIVKIYL